MPFCKSNCSTECPDKFGCVAGQCVDFEISQHSTRPAFILSISDCDGFIDTTGSIAEISMWAKAKFKKKVLSTDTYFSLANDVGFEQILIGDIIILDKVRNPEQMLVTGFDEFNKFVRVQREYNGTTAYEYKKNTGIKIFRTLNSTAEVEMVYEDVEQIDGTTSSELTDSKITYNWQANDTCLPGCYHLEIKLLKMEEENSSFSVAESIVPTFTSVTFDCSIGDGVSWVRRFGPYLIKIIASPTSEAVV